MREVLIRLPWDGIPLGGVTVPLFGPGVLLLLWIGLAAWSMIRDRQRLGHWLLPDVGSIFVWFLVAYGVWTIPQWGPRIGPHFATGLPIFGYGAMLLVGLVAAVLLAERRFRQAGLSAELVWDLALWLFIPGIIGARVFYLIQYRTLVYRDCQSTGDYLAATLNLSNGGIVLYGGLIAGAAAYFVFCAVKRLPPLQIADLITPSVFIGVGFGRIGCLLYGCCYGDRCDLPWAIVFPPGSVPCKALMDRGFLGPDATGSPPLHPTQLYSSFDGFLIACLTLWFHRHRRVPGEVLALALMLSSLTRFLIEFVRGDEYGQWGTGLTISQWISLGLFAAGIGLQLWLSRQPATSTSDKLSTRDGHLSAAR